MAVNVLAAAVLAAIHPAPADACRFDRAAVLALDRQAFDQDRDGGWRKVAQVEGCQGIAADLIRDYMRARGDRNEILIFHEAQLRAGIGETEQAIALFQGARRQNDSIGWNHYVDATVAFLRKDGAALLAARNRLAAIPRPADWGPRRMADGRLLEQPWPLNLNVVDGFIRCFARPYSQAYAPPCTAPLLRMGGRP